MDTWRNVFKNLLKKVKELSLIKNESKIKKLFLILSLLSFLVTCFIIYDNFQIAKTKPALEKTLNQFLIYTSNQDYAHAYAMLSGEVKTTIDFKTFQKMFADLRVFYADYKHNSLKTTNIDRRYDPIFPAQLTYYGIMTYLDKDIKDEISTNKDIETAMIEATFIWKNNSWELAGVYVYAPSSRLDKYSLPNY